jgi:nucleoside 2-deoxyribosyltransferase
MTAIDLYELARKLAQAPARNQVFVIIKCDVPALDAAFDEVYKPEGLAAGFDKVVRIQRAADSADLARKVVEQIATSRLVIADLSGERPNCCYEAGFAHALGKPVIFSTRCSDEVHFDLAAFHFIVWDDLESLRRQLRERVATHD